MGKLYAYLAGLGALLLSILGALGMAKRAGKKEAEADQVKANLQEAKKASDIDSKVNQSSDTAVSDELRKYTRD